MSSYSPNPTAAAQPAVTVRRSRRRIGILALLAIGTMINYLDRTVLGIAAPKLTAELGIDPAVILVMSFAFFGQGMVGLGWTLISDIAPKGLGGLTGGLFNFCANLAGILTPLVIGFIVAGFGNFFYALIYIGGAALLGVVAYLFILGDVKRIELSQ